MSLGGDYPKNKQIVYISGPITGTTDYLEQFENSENQLRGQGYEVINPAALHRGSPVRPWLEYLTDDLRWLSGADYIYLLPGWYRSHGARWEFRDALIRGIPVLNMSPLAVWFWSVVLDLTRSWDAEYIAWQRRQQISGPEGGSNAAISRR